MAGAAFGSCLKGLDVVERAARGLNLRDRRSTLEMACKFRGKRSIFCIWVCVCVAGATRGSFRPDSLALIHTHSLSLRLTDFQLRLIRARAQAY